MTVQARLLSFGVALILILAGTVALRRVSPTGAYDMVLLVPGLCVLVLATVLLGRRLTGATSRYPAGWTPGQDRLLRLARIANGLLIAALWSTLAYAMYRGMDFRRGHSLGIMLQALGATTFWLISLGPIDWSRSRPWQIHVFATAAFALGLMALASALARLPA